MCRLLLVLKIREDVRFICCAFCSLYVAVLVSGLFVFFSDNGVPEADDTIMKSISQSNQQRLRMWILKRKKKWTPYGVIVASVILIIMT